MTPGALDTAAEVTSTADWVNVVIAIIVGVATVAVAGQQLNRRARIRTQLSAELDIWASSPGSTSRRTSCLSKRGSPLTSSLSSSRLVGGHAPDPRSSFYWSWPRPSPH